MSRTRSCTRTCGRTVLACLIVAFSATAFAKEPPPQVSPEGLQLHESEDARIVYKRPGADFGKFRQVAILQPLVEFKEDWQRNYNRTAMGLQGRVRDEDMERMKKEISAEFGRVFEAELKKEGAYEIVLQGPADVLVLRPAIIDLEVSAPDLRSANARAIVRSAGAMTLYLELLDSTSNELLARIIDRQSDDGFGQVATRASNKAAATDILEGWAEKLRSHLDAARAADSAP